MWLSTIILILHSDIYVYLSFIRCRNCILFHNHLSFVGGCSKRKYIHSSHLANWFQIIHFLEKINSSNNTHSHSHPISIRFECIFWPLLLYRSQHANFIYNMFVLCMCMDFVLILIKSIVTQWINLSLIPTIQYDLILFY